MKKGILIAGIGAFALLGSCASNPSTKLSNEIGKVVRGSWALSDVDYRGFADNRVEGNVKVNETVSKVFDTASPDCYVGSSWNLVQNNKKGTYTFNNPSASCPQGTADIIWDLQQVGSDTYFIFKDVTGIKAKQNTAGYKMRVATVDQNSMKLIQDVKTGNKVAQVIYNFKR